MTPRVLRTRGVLHLIVCMEHTAWKIGHGDSVLLDRPRILGILNVTPDSFSDGGRHAAPDDALRHADRLIEEGADVIDIGGESTRPGAQPVDAREELGRVLPIIRALRRRHPGVPLSIDTVKSEVAEPVLDEGVAIVNDVSGFRLDARLAHICAAQGAGVVLMHSRGSVQDMASFTHATYENVVSEVVNELEESVRVAREGGVGPAHIVLDPGIGFAKRAEHSLEILAALPRLVTLGYPLLIGASRKRFVGEITGVKEASDRLAGSLGAHVAALCLGARLFRVHDVRETRQALDVAWAIVGAGAGAAA